MAVLRSGNSGRASGGWAANGRGGVLGALVSIGVVVVSVAGCSSAITPAPIVDRSTGGASAPASIPTTPPVAGPAVVAPSAPPEAGPGFYRVKPGDTLYGIARAQKQRPADLIKWNNLPESKQVNIDQLLRVAPPGSTPAATSNDDWSKAAATANVSKSGPPIIGGAAATASAPAVAASNAAPAKAAEAPDTSTPAVSAKGAWLAWPAQGDVVTKFGESGSKGIDIGGKVGEPVKAAAAGRVVYAGNGLRAYGNMIIVKHSSDYLTAYAHNSKLLVKEGDTVRQGTPIAEMGTGPSNKPLLHFELRKSGQAVDPVPSMKKAG
ncbi:peptidase [Caballeronia sordidicola]|uniref:Peptidase n=1 Tax=Caballeronia sordidicola TaxID=196367 RepID=A0A158HRJ9_CABSO|nr:peptidoglycan DD-metalloendopeptidase family protein [Caballeronia sordidicola]SAL46995.1 peptidase [Caballeronia sordidicola]